MLCAVRSTARGESAQGDGLGGRSTTSSYALRSTGEQLALPTAPSHRPDHLHPNEQPERADLSPLQKHVLDTRLIWCALAIASQVSSRSPQAHPRKPACCNRCGKRQPRADSGSKKAAESASDSKPADCGSSREGKIETDQACLNQRPMFCELNL